MAGKEVNVIDLDDYPDNPMPDSGGTSSILPETRPMKTMDGMQCMCVHESGQHNFQPYVPRDLCFPGPMFPGTYVSRALCSPGTWDPGNMGPEEHRTRGT